MNRILFTIFIIISVNIYAQNIGKIQDEYFEAPKEIQLKNGLGLDLLFSDGGFGLGCIYKRVLPNSFALTLDVSMSETKDDEKEEYNYYTGEYEAMGKVNRILLVPLYLGLQYRLFENIITESVRPYISIAVGPTFVMATPYQRDFFAAFGHGTYYTAPGGYISFGANFGSDTKSMVGLNAKYNFVRVLNGHGIEGLEKKYRENLGQFYLTLTIGTML